MSFPEELRLTPPLLRAARCFAFVCAPFSRIRLTNIYNSRRRALVETLKEITAWPKGRPSWQLLPGVHFQRRVNYALELCARAPDTPRPLFTGLLPHPNTRM